MIVLITEVNLKSDMTLSKFSYLPSFPNQFFFSIEPGIENSHDRFLIAIRFLLIEHVEEVVVKRGFTGNGTKQWRILTGGRGHPDPEIREGGRSQKIFSALLVSVWSKNKGGWKAPQAPLLDLPLGK